jgi:hypothetical protein
MLMSQTPSPDLDRPGYMLGILVMNSPTFQDPSTIMAGVSPKTPTVSLLTSTSSILPESTLKDIRN